MVSSSFLSSKSPSFFATILYANLPSVGCSPASAFLSWRLQASRAYNVSIAWDNPHRAYSINSVKFGTADFVPDALHDPARLDSVGPVDVVLFSATSLKSLSVLHRTAASVIRPHHTIILLDATGYVGLHELISGRFPNNPVCSVSTEAALRLVHIDNSSSYNNSPVPLLIHSGHSTKTWVSPSASEFRPALGAFALALQKGDIETVIASNYDQLQWDQVIPFLAFQPLSLMLEAKTPQALISNILSKPLYSGIIAELMTIAIKSSNHQFGPDYLSQTIDNFQASASSLVNGSANGELAPSPTSLSSTSTITYPNSKQLLDAPELYYNYFHSLPIHVDLLLLQPILLADNQGIKTPYLESIFAFMSQIVSYNDNKSVFLMRKNVATSGGSINSGKEKELEERERQLGVREKQIEIKEQKLGQWSASLQRMPQPSQQRGSLPVLPQGPPTSQPAYRPHSAMPSVTRPGTAMADPNKRIDMMQITSQRNRRASHKLRTSSSTASLVNLAAAQQPSVYHAKPGGASRQGNRPPTNNGGSFAVLTDPSSLYSGLADNRYGSVDSSKLSKSRSNSITMDNMLRQKPGSSPALFTDHFLPNLHEGVSSPRGNANGGALPHKEQYSVGPVPRVILRPTPTPSPPAAAGTPRRKLQADPPVAPTISYTDESSNPYHFRNPYSVETPVE